MSPLLRSPEGIPHRRIRSPVLACSIHNTQAALSACLANSLAIHPPLRLAFAAHLAHTKESRVFQQEPPRGTNLLCGGACRQRPHPLPARAGPAGMRPGNDLTFHAQALRSCLHARERLNQPVMVHDLEASRVLHIFPPLHIKPLPHSPRSPEGIQPVDRGQFAQRAPPWPGMRPNTHAPCIQGLRLQLTLHASSKNSWG